MPRGGGGGRRGVFLLVCLEREGKREVWRDEGRGIRERERIIVIIKIYM